MQVRYIHGEPGKFASNIMWSPAVPMRNGKFPPNHPVAAGSTFHPNAGDSQLGTSDAMNRFRERGYWASCFPEGDGITMNCLNGQDAEKVAADIAEVFGWNVTQNR
jgi:hypothetical protein